MKHNPRCEKSPTGAHRADMVWRDGPTPASPRTYWHVCRDCGLEWQADETLGEKGMNRMPDGTTFYRGKRSEFRLARSKGVQE
jgi:hypothetical protein